MLRLTFERKQRGWSQSDLALLAEKLLGSKTRLRRQRQISELELGKICPTDAELDALGELLEVSPPFHLLRHIAVIDLQYEDKQVPA